MKDMNNEALLKFAKESSLSTLRLRARCDALEALLTVLAMKSGMSKEDVRKAIASVEKESYERQMIQAEDKIGPGFAAEIDGPSP